MPITPTVPPTESFQREVLPNYRCYTADRICEWKAKNAAYAAGHLIEWVYHYYNHHDSSRLEGARDLAEFRANLFKKCGELQIVWDLAEASKHRFLTRRPEMRVVTTATDAFGVKEERLFMPDCDRYFDDVITAATNFWQRWLGLDVDRMPKS